MNKLSEIQSLQKEIEKLKGIEVKDGIATCKYCLQKYYSCNCDEIKLLQAKLSTWKQALTYQLKELDEDIADLTELDFFVRGKIRIGATDRIVGLMNNNLGEIRFKIKQKLTEKQSKKAEINKELKEIA